jgi:hypothetical protein
MEIKIEKLWEMSVNYVVVDTKCPQLLDSNFLSGIHVSLKFAYRTDWWLIALPLTEKRMHIKDLHVNWWAKQKQSFYINQDWELKPQIP